MEHHPRPEKIGELTQILDHLRMGKKEAEGDLFKFVYSELRGLAAGMMARERSDHTLQTTALVHEAYLRLMRGEDASWENRAHFFGAAARAMRQILVDYARRAGSAKRGGHQRKIGLTDLPVVMTADAEDVLVINEALDALGDVDPRKARLVELRFFGGLSFDEVADVLDVSPRTVKRDWSFAKAWLSRRLRQPENSESE
ncbi:MAG: sigma-70 family RNA polymerase sigma factor [Phycisphaerales bacterium]|nr:sigma-70 family RNA polymerase sigma factor [Phycisphaerales bacterium]